MRSVRNLPFLFVFLLGLIGAFPSHAWGPISHQVFGCRILGLDDSACFETPSGRSLVLGSSAPDAFKLYLEGGHRIHGFDYAGFQLRYAMEHTGPATPGFDALAYSRGFGSHLAEDEVGHHDDGYLPGGVGATWDHLHEAVTDMFLERTFSGRYAVQYFSSFGEPVVDFSTAVIRAYGRERGDDTLAQASRDSVAEAMRRFDSLEAWEQRVGAFDFFYRREIVFFDPYSASDLDEAQENLERAASCSVEAAGTWRENVSNPDSSPPAPERAVHDAVKTFFRQGRCQPPPRP